MREIEAILATLPDAVSHTLGRGKPADYIPALAEVCPNKFGMAISTVDGRDHVVGDAEENFSIQSISKVFSLSLAMHYAGESVFERIGRRAFWQPV